MNIEIKFATKNDVALILHFIKELAIYEKLAHEVVVTEGLLSEKLFGEKKYAEVILAYIDKNPIGFAVFFHNFSTFLGKPGIYLEDLYVIPEMRKKGVAKKLFSFLANLALERDCARLDWCVLDWNTLAIDFYKKIGASSDNEWILHSIKEDRLNSLAQLSKSE